MGKDLRRMMISLGPVGVFAASNFPLAFSTAGGDSASALAAGCPVVMKAHSAHPKTSDLVGKAVIRAARAQGMPEGVFSMVYGRVVGLELVKHPAIKAIGFTGSYSGGRMFTDAAAARPEPIPVFAEMGSINPVFVLPEAIQGDGAASVATALAASITQGAGQFCTNPGSIFVVDSPDVQVFLSVLALKIAATPTQPMLTPGIRDAYRAAVDSLISHGARAIASGAGDDPARPMLLSAPASALLKDAELAEECFGPCSCVFLADSPKTLLAVLGKLAANSLAPYLPLTAILRSVLSLCQPFPGKSGEWSSTQYQQAWLSASPCNTAVRSQPPQMPASHQLELAPSTALSGLFATRAFLQRCSRRSCAMRIPSASCASSIACAAGSPSSLTAARSAGQPRLDFDHIFFFVEMLWRNESCFSCSSDERLFGLRTMRQLDLSCFFKHS